jgi:hypothetical protein
MTSPRVNLLHFLTHRPNGVICELIEIGVTLSMYSDIQNRLADAYVQASRLPEKPTVSLVSHQGREQTGLSNPLPDTS